MSWEFIGLGLSPTNTEQTQLYRDMWARLAAMPKLNHAKIAVAAHECPYPAPPDLKEVWLGPPKLVGKMDVFEILVPLSYARSFNFGVGEVLNFTLKSFPDIFTMQYCFGSSANTWLLPQYGSSYGNKWTNVFLWTCGLQYTQEATLMTTKIHYRNHLTTASRSLYRYSHNVDDFRIKNYEAALIKPFVIAIVAKFLPLKTIHYSL